MDGSDTSKLRRKLRAAGLSVLTNIFLSSAKLVAGLVTGSVALLSEAVHSSIDLLAALVAFISVRKSAQPADDRHHYGHDKIENLAAAIEGALMFIGAAYIAFEAVDKLRHGGTLNNLDVGLTVAGASAVLTFAVARYLKRVAVITDSAALSSDAKHLLADSLSSIVVLVGLLVALIFDESRFDGVVALLVAAWMFYIGMQILLQATRVLVDEALPDHELEAIKMIVRSSKEQGVVGFHELRSRKAGARRYIDMHLQFRAGMTLDDAHQIAHKVEEMIALELENADILIHIEPESSLKTPLT